MFFGEPFGGLIPGVHGAVLATLLRTDVPLTGRQVHAVIGDKHSLWTVQQALKTLAQLGVVDTRTVGRAGVHTINDDHASVASLRDLLDPIAALTHTVREAIGDEVETVILFGSIARGEATIDSDVDLAVIAPAGWDGGADLEDAVRSQLGNTCDVLVLTLEDLRRGSDAGEPVVHDVLTDGVALLGSMPRPSRGVA